MQHKVLYIFVVLCLLNLKSFSQISDGNVIVNAEVPNVTMDVGEEAQLFFVSLKNSLHENLVNEATFTISHPVGVEVDYNSVSLITDRDDVQLFVEPFDISNPNRLKISVTITSGLDFDEEVKIAYKASANCAIIPQRMVGEKAKPIVVSNDIQCSYTNNSGVLEFVHNSSTVFKTNSYNVLYADLMLILTDEDIHIDGYRYMDYVGKVTFFNSVSAGKTSHIRVLVTSDEVNLTFTDATICNMNSQNEEGVAISRQLLSGNVFYYDIDSVILKRIGLGKSLDGGEGFCIKERVWISGVANTIEKKFQTQWGKTFDMICNNDPVGSANGSAIVYIENSAGTPKLEYERSVVSKPTFCSGVGIARFIMSNTDINKKSGAFNLNPYFDWNKGLNINEIYVDTDDDGICEQRVNIIKTARNFAYLILDKTSGFKDLDRDGKFNDLEAGAKIVFEVYYSLNDYREGKSDMITDINNNGYYRFLNFYPNQYFNNYNRLMGHDFSLGLRDFMRFDLYSSNFDGNQEIYQDVTRQKYSFTAGYNYYYPQLTLPCESNKVTARLELPLGFKLNDDKVYLNRVETVFNKESNRIIVEVPENRIFQDNTFDIYLDLECLPYVRNGLNTILGSLAFICKDCTGEREIINYLRKEVNAHFDCLPKYINNLQMSLLERKSVGWKNDGTLRKWHLKDLTDEKKIDLNKDDKSQFELDKAYCYDDVGKNIKFEINPASIGLFNKLKIAVSTSNYQYLKLNDVTVTIGDKIIDNSNFEYGYVSGNGQQIIINNVGDVAGIVEIKLLYKIIGDIPILIPNPNTNDKKYSTISGFNCNISLQHDEEIVSVKGVSSNENFRLYRPISFVSSFFGNESAYFKYDIYNCYQFNNEYRPVFHFTNFEFEMPSYFKVDNVSGSGIFNGISTNNYEIDSNNKFKIKVETLPFNDNIILSNRVDVKFKNNCKTEIEAITKKKRISISEFDFANPEINSSNPNSIENIHSFLGDRIDVADIVYSASDVPLLSLELESYQSGIKNKARWITRIVENNRAPSSSNWIAFEPAEGNKSKIIIENAYTEDGKTAFTKVKRYGDNQQGLLVDVGAIEKNGSVKIILDASYADCVDGTIDHINVFAGRDAESVSKYNQPSDYPSECTLTGMLDLAIKTANMQWEVKQVEKRSFKLCEEVKYTIDLKSTGLASMYNPSVWLNLPLFASLTDDVKVRHINSNNESTSYILSKNDLVDGIPYQLENLIPSLKVENEGFPGNSRIELDFGVSTVCGFDAGSFVEFNASGTSNCSDKLVFKGSKRIPITGFTDLESIKTFVLPVNMTGWNVPTNVSVQVNNIGLTSVTPTNVEVVLSPGLSYVPGSAAELGEPTIAPAAEGKTKLTWSWPSGVTILAGKSKIYSFRIVTSGSDCSITSDQVAASVYTKRFVASDCGAPECEVIGTYDKFVRSFTRPPFSFGTPVKPSYTSGPSSVLGPDGVLMICKDGSPMSFTHGDVSNIPNVAVSYEWSIWIPGRLLPEVVSGTAAEGAVASIGVDADGNAVVTWAEGASGRYEIKVRKVNTCKTSGYSAALAVDLVRKSERPTGIDGPLAVCAGSSVEFKVSDAVLQPKYRWSVDGGGEVLPNSVNGTATIRFPAASLPVIVSVLSYNQVCGMSEAVQKAVTVNPLPNARFSGLNLNKTYCIDGSVAALTPEVSGGTFAGVGLENRDGVFYFNPQIAGRGEHTITYTLTENGCTATSEEKVLVTAPMVDIIGLKQNYCLNTPAFKLQGTPAGGVFTIADKDRPETEAAVSSFDPALLQPGIFVVKYSYTDPSTGCSGMAVMNVQVHDLPRVTIVADRTMPVCANEDVELTAGVAEGGRAPYTYMWSPVASGQSYLKIKTKVTTDYKVNVMDNTGCIVSAGYRIDVLPTPEVIIEEITPVSCRETKDGKVIFSAAYSGADALTCKVYPSSVAEAPIVAGVKHTIENLAYGYPVIEVTSTNGCRGISTPFIDHGGPTFSVTSDPVVCAGYNNQLTPVFFTIKASRLRPQPTGEFRYTITGSSGSITGVGTFGSGELRAGPVNALPGDTFTFNVSTDDLSASPNGNGCYVSPIDVKVRAVDILLDPVSKVKFVQCRQGDPVEFKAKASLSDGSLKLNSQQLEFRLMYAENGVYAPVENSGWKLAEAGNSITYPNITKPGSYRIEVMYSGKEMCTQPLYFTIEESKLAVSVVTRDVRCFGENDGRITAAVKGNVGEVQYLWVNATLDPRQTTSQVIEKLKPGIYNLTVTDSETGCNVRYPSPIEIKEPDKLKMPEIIVDNNNPCQPYAQIEGGGVPKYTFNWYKAIQKTSTIYSIFSRKDKKKVEKIMVIIDSVHVYSDLVDGNVSQPPKGTTKNGYYFVEVVDANGCRVKMKPAKDITPEVGEREYNLAFRWVTKPVDVDTSKAPINETVNNSLAESVSKTVEFQLDKCIKKYVDSYLIDLERLCHSPGILKDSFTVSYADAPHYYHTLYYYDRAGNLISTVAPEGVRYVNSRNETPQHEFRTLYYYNSLGQVVGQETPDAGESEFIYNSKGQLRFSQNAQQRKDGTCSYSKYDELGRVIESGVYKGSGTGLIAMLKDIVEDEDTKGYDEDDGGISAAKRFPNTEDEQTLMQIAERTVTIYSNPNLDLIWNGSPQRYLLNRISQVHSYTIDGSRVSAYYSYDPHGNVEWVVNEIPGLGKTGVNYRYDLISNKVTGVGINEKRKDSFYHKYSYDEDNRIQQVFSSVNGLVWSNDATYYYYEHGPLRRVELGHNKVQGIDYAYTLNGWLKAINTPDLEFNGEDKSKGFAPDLFGMVLGYYDGDFVKKNSNRFTITDKHRLPVSAENGGNLYNGNISSWVTGKLPAIPGVNAGEISGMSYSYDLLNRIKSAKFSTLGAAGFAVKPDYAESFSYDLNGNITGLQRKGNSANGLDMDDLTYTYNTDASRPKNNRLLSITDRVVAPTGYDDIKSQEADNYSYDEIGNLTGNKEDKIEIRWNASGKISEVRPVMGSGKPHLVYWYDASGSRIRKQANSMPDYDANGSITGAITNPESVTTTYYLRDAQGNTLAVYERNNVQVGTGDSYKALFTLSELPIYGSDRIGMYTPKNGGVLASIMFKKADFDKVTPELDRIVTALSGSGNMLVASEQVVTLDPGTTSADGSGSAATTVATTTTVGNVTAAGAAYSLSNKLTFTGNLGGTMAFGESETGELRFYVVPAAAYLGANNPAVLVFNANNELMMNSDNLQLDPNRKITVTRVPGEGSERYLILGADTEGNLRSSTVDMNLNNGMGDIAYKNELVASGGYDGCALTISDRAALSVKVLAGRVSGGNLELQTLQYQGGAWQGTPKTQLIVPGSFGAASLQLSPDGKQLAVYHYTTTEGDFGIRKAQLLTYNVADNLTFAPDAQPMVAYSADGTLQASYGCMAEFTAKGDLVYTTSTTERKYGAWLLAGAAPTALVESGCAGLRLLPDGKLLLGQSKSSTIGLYNPEANTVVPLALTGDTAVGDYTGYLTNNYWYVNPEGRPDRTDSYTAGLRSYELKDHLGNVRVVVNDARTAASPASATAAYQYYAFGSPMPGRYGLANLVGQGGYRYGFNGKEKDDDLTKTTGATYDYGFRVYDARIAKFLSVDPLTTDYPSWSPYPFAMNRVVDGIDLDGLELLDYRANYIMKVGKLQFYGGNSKTVFSLVRESTGNVHSTFNMQNQLTESLLAPEFTPIMMKASDAEAPKYPKYKIGGSKASKHYNKVRAPFIWRNQKSGSTADAFSLAMESAYTAMQESSSAKADDELQAIAAFKTAVVVVVDNRERIMSEFNNMNWTGDFAERMKSDNAFKEQIFNGGMADITNYIVGRRDEKRDFSNYPLGHASNFDQYKLFVYRMGEQLSRENLLNTRLKSNKGFVNILWRTIKSMQPNSNK